MDTTWETDLAALLSELSDAQDELFDVLESKRRFLVTADATGMQSLEPRERQIIERLEACQDHRGRLLDRAAREGLPTDSICSLTAALPSLERQQLAQQASEAANRWRLLQHQSLTNWVIVQRTLLYLSQLFEIIATGGRVRPTYGKSECAHSGGSLVDRAA
jgi:flagellar FlgN protein